MKTKGLVKNAVSLSREAEQSLLAETDLYQSNIINAEAALEEAQAIYAAKQLKSSAAKEKSAILRGKYYELKIALFSFAAEDFNCLAA